MKKLLMACCVIMALAYATNVMAQDPNYTVKPGDMLSISVWKEPDLQKETLVRPDGSVAARFRPLTDPLAPELIAAVEGIVPVAAGEAPAPSAAAATPIGEWPNVAEFRWPSLPTPAAPAPPETVVEPSRSRWRWRWPNIISDTPCAACSTSAAAKVPGARRC